MTACTRCATAIEDGDLRCAICALPVPDHDEAPRTLHAQVLRCRECHAAVAFSVEHGAPRCAFCAATMELEALVDPPEVAEVHVPFTVSRATAEASLRSWLGKRGYFAPPALRDDAVLESLTPLCWAGWRVHARAAVTWTADSDAGAQRSPWAPHAGQVALHFDGIVVPASRGLDDDECRRLVPYYDLAHALPVREATNDGVVDEVVIESFEAQRSAARQAVQRAIEATARTRVQPHIPGRRYRNVRVACLLEGQTTERIALPAWVLAYRYRGRAYRAIVHGQRPEIVLGRSPLDLRKLARVIATVGAALALIICAVVLLAACGGPRSPIDAPDFTEHCTETAPFGALTGRAAIQGTLNVHVDAGGLIKVDTTSTLLLAMDLIQTGTQLAVRAEVCKIEVPDVPLVGQDMPIHFEIPDAAIASVGSVAGTASLSSPDQACTDFRSEPITLVLGARLDPATIATAPLPIAADDGSFPACAPSAMTPCATAVGTGCACDQEGDTFPGTTLIAHNVPALDLDQAYVTLRTTFTLRGQVFSTNSVRGLIDATLDTGVLACRLRDGTPCSAQNVRTVRTLDPVVTQQPTNPSTFRSVRIADGMTCAEIVRDAAILFPR